MAHPKVARQRMMGSAITTTTPGPRTDLYKVTCTESQSEKVSVVVKFTRIRTLIVVLRISQIFFLSHRFASKQWQLLLTRREEDRQHLTERTPALFLAAHARTQVVITRLAQVLDDLFLCPEVISSPVMSLLNVPSNRFRRVLSSRTASVTPPTASPTPLSGIRLNPRATPLGWTV